jgi:hypothetical protein
MFRGFGCLPPFLKNVSKESECRLDRMNEGERKILNEYFAGPPWQHVTISNVILAKVILPIAILAKVILPIIILL